MIAYGPPNEPGRAEPGLRAEELEESYAAYRRRQALALVHLMPRDAVRPLVRAARAAGFDGGGDPLDMLVSYCETFLPLPPFQVWLDDLRRHPVEHLRDIDASPDAPTAAAPTTVEVRSLTFGDTAWRARLELFRGRAGWRGFIAFEDEASGRAHRTATIFHEEDPAELRARFLDLEDASLEAFLRSTLP